MHQARRDKDKFGIRSKRCVFVGYPFGKKGWKVYDMEKEEFFVSRDVVFDEKFYPYADKEVAETRMVPQMMFVCDDEINSDRGSGEVTTADTVGEVVIADIVGKSADTEVAQRSETEMHIQVQEETPQISD